MKIFNHKKTTLDETIIKPELVIGLVGPIASGKGIISDLLTEIGFSTYRLSDLLKERMEKELVPITREGLQDYGNLMRRFYHLGVLTEWACDRIRPDEKKVVIDGIRNLGEISYLRERFGDILILIGVEADNERRQERYAKRALLREEDLPHESSFEVVSGRDRGERSETGQQVDACLLEVDYLLYNDLDEARFREQAREFLAEKLGLAMAGVEGRGRHSLETESNEWFLDADVQTE